MTATAGPKRDADNPGYGDCRCPCHFDHESGMRTYHVTACCYPEPAKAWLAGQPPRRDD